jgi:hypothetical protein
MTNPITTTDDPAMKLRDIQEAERMNANAEVLDKAMRAYSDAIYTRSASHQKAMRMALIAIGVIKP